MTMRASPPQPTASLAFRAVRADSISDRLPGLFAEFWPAYREWFLRQGDQARPTYAESRRMLRLHMPELLPLYDELTEAVGGGDAQARLLALYRPTPYLSGCSQAVLLREEPVLVRNYDYRPDLCEGLLLRTQWLGRTILAMSDCLWGVLDGVNDAGLALALSFGGRPVVGDGFGIPLVLRYILQTCERVDEAAATLCRIPIHMAYNVTLLDARGEVRTVQVAPDRPPGVTDRPVATNHQGAGDWPRYALLTSSEERERFLLDRVNDAHESAEALEDRFLQPPLHSRNFHRGWGTLYTASYRPRERSIRLRWPGLEWRRTIDAFEESRLDVAIAW